MFEKEHCVRTHSLVLFISHRCVGLFPTRIRNTKTHYKIVESSPIPQREPIDDRPVATFVWDLHCMSQRVVPHSMTFCALLWYSEEGDVYDRMTCESGGGCAKEVCASSSTHHRYKVCTLELRCGAFSI